MGTPSTAEPSEETSSTEEVAPGQLSADQERSMYLGIARTRRDMLPWVTFTDPEVARVGITEAEGAELGGWPTGRWPTWTGPWPPAPPTASSSW